MTTTTTTTMKKKGGRTARKPKVIPQRESATKRQITGNRERCSICMSTPSEKSSFDYFRIFWKTEGEPTKSQYLICCDLCILGAVLDHWRTVRGFHELAYGHNGMYGGGKNNENTYNN